MRGYCTGGRLLSSGCSRPFSMEHGNRPTCKVHFPSTASPSAAPSGEPGCVQVWGWLTGAVWLLPSVATLRIPLQAFVYIRTLRFSDRGDLKSPLHRDAARARLWHRSQWADLFGEASQEQRASKALLVAQPWPPQAPVHRRIAPQPGAGRFGPVKAQHSLPKWLRPRASTLTLISIQLSFEQELSS